MNNQMTMLAAGPNGPPGVGGERPPRVVPGTGEARSHRQGCQRDQPGEQPELRTRWHSQPPVVGQSTDPYIAAPAAIATTEEGPVRSAA